MAPPPDTRPGQAAQVQLQAWIAEYGPALRRYFLKKVAPAEADDLVQDVFLAMHARGAAEPVEDIQRYLFRVASHVLARRHRDREPFSALDDDFEIVDEVSPERLLINRQDVARVTVAIQKLPPRCREAFVLHRFEEMTYAAIAKRMGVSLHAVRNLISRSIARLTDELELRP